MPHCSFLSTHACTLVNGKWAPCCRFKDTSDEYSITDYTYEEYKNTNFFKDLKKTMSKGWHQGCTFCKVTEDNGFTESYRQTANRKFGRSNELKFLELSLSNKCNQACKICNPKSSSKWEKLFNDNNDLTDFFNFNSVKFSWKDILANTDITHLTDIKYLGGEPFITPETKEFFDYLEDANLLGKISLHSNTNCSFFPAKWISQLKKFNSVMLGLSIDGYKQSNTYSRVGSNWQDTENALHKWVYCHRTNRNITVYIHACFSALTIHDYDKLHNYAKKFNLDINPTIVDVPTYLSINCLPDEYKDEIRTPGNSKILDKFPFEEEKFVRMQDYIKRTDKIQGINIKDYIPLLAKYLDK